MAKYLAKKVADRGGGSPDVAARSAAVGEDLITGAYLAVEEEGGYRSWYIWGQEFVPWAVLKVVELVMGPWFYKFRRIARRKWAGLREGRVGFTLFVENVEVWDRALALCVCNQYAGV